ncbi:MAG: AraC family transcriptional regulator [Candidatus Izemoplasmatales bacterium]
MDIDTGRETALNALHAGDLRLFEAGKEKNAPAKDVPPDVAKEYHLLRFVLSGKGVILLDGKEYHLVKGDAFLIPAGSTAHGIPDEKEPWTVAWFGFNGPRGDDLLGLLGIAPATPLFTGVRDDSLSGPLLELVDNAGRVGFLDLKCLGYAYIVFSLMADHRLDRASRVTTKEQHVKAAKEFITGNFQLPITVAEIAGAVGLTPNYLSNIFQGTLGLSPKQYLTQYRMEKACILLLDRRALVKDVAERVGYKNQLHFSGEFKKAIGLSPKHYQEKKAKRA